VLKSDLTADTSASVPNCPVWTIRIRLDGAKVSWVPFRTVSSSISTPPLKHASLERPVAQHILEIEINYRSHSVSMKILPTSTADMTSY